MSALPDNLFYQPTIEAIYKNYETTAQDWRRPHLGASLIGRECCRDLWLTFRWALAPNFEGRILRLFESGNVEENRVLMNLAAVGVTITGQQDRLGSGHFSGSCDGRGTGFRESKQEHIIEIKTANKTSFNKIKKHGVKEATPEHFAQMQIYMHWAGLKRAYYICVCKDSDEIHGERIEIDNNAVAELLYKAQHVIYSPIPCEKAGDSAKSMVCKWCHHASLCWEDKLPEVSCRTCAHATPEPSGEWTCARYPGGLSVNDQKAGCNLHIYIPTLVPSEAIDADPEKGTITYANGITNGPGCTSSEEMRHENRCEK